MNAKRIWMGSLVLASAPVIFAVSAKAQAPAGPPQDAPGMQQRFGPRGPQGLDRGRGFGPRGQWDNRRDFRREMMERRRHHARRGWNDHRRFRGRFDRRWDNGRGPFGRPFFGDFGPRFGPGFGRPGRGPIWWQSPMMRDRLGLTQEQMNRLQTQSDAAERARIQRRADLEIKQREFDQLMRSPNPDRAAIDRKMQELSTARLAEEKAAMEERFSSEGVLTPEQKEKLKQMRNEPPEEMMRRGRPQGPGRQAPPQRPQPPQQPQP